MGAELRACEPVVRLCAAGEDLPEQDAVAPDVCLGAEALVPQRLGRGPLDRHEPGLGAVVPLLRRHHPREPKVAHLGHEPAPLVVVEVLLQQDVPAGEVAVHDPQARQVQHPRGDASIILSGSVLLGKSPSSITFSGTVMEGFAVVMEADNAGLCEDDDDGDKMEGEEDAAYVLSRSRRAPFGMNSVTMYVEP